MNDVIDLSNLELSELEPAPAWGAIRLPGSCWGATVSGTGPLARLEVRMVVTVLGKVAFPARTREAGGR